MAVLSTSLQRLSGLALLVGILGWLAAPSLAAPSEEEVKAAYLFNFARYVTWPADRFSSPTDPIRICVVDDEGFRDVLESTIAGKTVEDRPVKAVSRSSVGGASDCHIAFLRVRSGSEAASLSNNSVFTVSDYEGFAKSGGIANFVRSGSKIRFEINAVAATEAGLQVSSRLLRLAKVVE